LQSHLLRSLSCGVVASSGALLVSAAPFRAGEGVVGLGYACPDELDQQAADFGQCQGDELAVADWVVDGMPPFFDRVTVRKAWASMDRVMWRYQPLHCRT
ncbi:hypothetical protein SAMN06265360_1702, partial [Haloechinothrix alba]